MAPGRAALDYASLFMQTDRLAGGLSALGLWRTDVVAVVMPDGPEMLAVFLAVSEVAICAPLNPAFREHELKFYLADLRARVLIVQDGASECAASVASELGIAVLVALPDDRGPAGALELRRMAPLSARRESGYARDTALLLRTSATTGRQKLGADRTSPAHRHGRDHQDVSRKPMTAACNITPQFHMLGIVSRSCSSSREARSSAHPASRASSFLEWMDDFGRRNTPQVRRCTRAILALLPLALRWRRSRPCGMSPTPARRCPRHSQLKSRRRLGMPVLEAYGLTGPAASR